MQLEKISDGKIYALIIVVGAILFMPFLGNVHLFDWDEANFAEAAREMIVQGEYMRVYIDYKPFWEKPPIFIWMQAAAMHIFGINEYAARFPNAVMGILTLCSLFFIGKKVANKHVAIWWVLLYIGSWLPHFYFKTAIIDPTFNFFIFWAVYFMYRINFSEKRWLNAILVGISLGLAVLTKGPSAILICLLCLAVFFIVKKGKWGYTFKDILIVSLSTLLTTFSWFGWDILQNGWWFTNEFITYQIRLFSTGDAGHGQPFFYHWVVLLIGCFPAAAFLFQTRKSTFSIAKDAYSVDFSKWMWILFGVVLMLFSIVKTKIVHYSSMCYLPLTYLAAIQISQLVKQQVQLKRIVKALTGFTGILLGFALLILPIAAQNLDKIIPLVKDPFAQDNMQAEVSWPIYYVIFGALIIVSTLFFLWKSSKDFIKSMGILVSTQIVAIFCSMVFIVPKIEQYSQGAAIEFYKEIGAQNAYIQPLGMKSYAYLFYSNVLPSEASSLDADAKIEWLLNGEIDKPAYFICRNNRAEEFNKHKNLEMIGKKNGYVFFKRIH